MNFKISVSGKGLACIHLAVFLFGFSGLFGKFLSCSPFYIVFGRTFFASLALLLFILWFSKTKLSGFEKKQMFFFMLQGILLAAHWTCFFYSIQISSVAVGLVTFSSFPLFVTFLEPFFFNEHLKTEDIIAACAVFAGIVLIIPDFNFSHNMTKGVFYGIASGLTFALLALVNRRNARESDSIAIAFYQNLFACFFLIIPCILTKGPVPVFSDLPYLMILGLACTALAHTLFIKSLAFIKAQTAAVISGLEPVYGIVFAFLLLNEIPATRTLAGGAVIIGTTVLSGILSEGH